MGSAIFLVASGFSMFAFLRSFFASQPALFGAVVYAILPYHLLVDWFERQAAGEFAAYAFLPLIALGVERIRTGKRGDWILALGVAGTALSHLPTTLLAAHVFGAVALVFVLRADGSRLGLLARFTWFALLGLALAGCYWVPAVVLLETVSPDVLFDPYFEAWHWLYGSASAKPTTDFALVLSAAFLACAPLLLGASLSARGPVLVWILVPASVALFLNSVPSEPIWRNWIIAKVQFPWRLLTFVDFSTGIAAAVLLARATSRAGRLALSAVLLAAIVPAAFVAREVKVIAPQDLAAIRSRGGFAAVEYFSPEMQETLRVSLDLIKLGHFDQWQVSATVADMAVEFTNTLPDVKVVQRGHRSLTVLPPQGAEVLSLPVQYWFLWSARTSSGAELEIRPNQSFGTLDIIAPTGGFNGEPVRVFLRLHPSELVGGALSLLAMIVLLAATVRSRPGRR